MPDLDIAQANLRQHRHFVADRGDGLEHLHRVLHRHVEHVGDRQALPFDLQRFAVVAFAVAFLARHIDVGQEVHLDFDQAIAATCFAASALDVEAEPARLISARGAFGQLREPVADVGERAGIGCGVRPWRAANGGLVDVDHLVAMFQPCDLVMRARNDARAI